MLDLADIHGHEFMRPLVQGWLSKVEGALSSQPRKRWKDVSEECLMFYNKSAAAMWDGDFTKKFWRGVKAPRFRVTINKAFEYVAVVGPNLLWDIPHRTVTPKKQLEIPQELFPQPELYQAIMAQAGQETAKDKLVAHLMQTWLNYTPREQPMGGLELHNELGVLDAMLTGQGLLWPAVYNFPSSERTLTGCFRKPPQDLIFDPDFKTAAQSKWVALRHTDPHWEVERRFKLPPNSLKNRASLESAWHFAETSSQQGRASGDRQSGKTNDLVVWYEIWSKLGTGARMTGMPDMIKGPLEELVGDYAYLCVCPDCPYPLNCPADVIRQGASPQQVRECFEWPVPLWTDSRWPFEQLVFYHDPDSPYGLPPLSPALGELKAINAIVSWLVNRTWHSSRQMWAVLGQYHDDMKKVLDEGDDQTVFPLPPGAGEDITKILQLVEMKEVNKDAWSVLELLSNTFDKRMGMTPFVYGQNEDGTQDRTAETTSARKSAVSARPEYMQKKVVGWQSRVAGVEGMLAWMFVKAQDTVPLLGQAGSQLWQQYIENGEHEEVMRQMRFEIAASSIRRPNRERDISNLQEVVARWLPVMQVYGETSGNYEPVNGTMKKWAELHDMEGMEQMMFPAKDPNDPNAQLDQQLKQAEVQKTKAEAQKLQAEAQANPMLELQMDQQNEQAKLAMDMQAKQQDAQIKMAESQAQLEMDVKRLEAELAMKQMELKLKMAEHQMDMQFRAQEGQVDLAVKKEQGAQQIAQGRQQMQMQQEQHQQQLKQGAATTKSKVDATQKTAQAKVQATKAVAAAKPKPKAA